MHTLTNFLLLNARGTIIEIPLELAQKSPVLNDYIENKWKDSNEPYYLNYSKETVHMFLDYLSGDTIKKLGYIYRIYNELMIKDEKILFDNKKMSIGASNISKAKEDINKIYGNSWMTKDQSLLVEYLTYLSWNAGYHLHFHKFNINELPCAKNINTDVLSFKEIIKCLNGAIFTHNNKYWFKYQIQNNINTHYYKYDEYDIILIDINNHEYPIKRIKYIK